MPVLGFGQAPGGDEVFCRLVLARIIESASMLGFVRVLGETGSSRRPTVRCGLQGPGQDHRGVRRV